MSESFIRISIDNKGDYGILSKGIFELSEDEHNEYFNLFRSTIDLVLDDQIRLKEDKIKRESITKELSRIEGKLSN